MTHVALKDMSSPRYFSFSTRELGLIDAPAETAFDALTRLARRLFQVPVALVSIIDEPGNRQYFKSMLGLPEPWASRRETPLSHSFCQHVKNRAEPLVVPFSANHPLVCDNLAIRDLNVQAYLGAPILGPDGNPLGALCVIDGHRRDWSDDDVALISDIAACVSDEIALRAALRSNNALFERLQESHRRMTRYTVLRESIAMAFMAPDMTSEERFHALLDAGCRALNADRAAIARFSGPDAKTIFSVDRNSAGEAMESIPQEGALCALAAQSDAITCHHDLPESDHAGRHTLFGEIPGSFAVAPILNDGVPFGVLELSHRDRRAAPWDQEELSALSIIAMFASAHLTLYGQIAALKRSETLLLDQLLQSKRHMPQPG